MNLIAIKRRQIGEGEIQTVNARDLHTVLRVGKDFSTWIKAQIERARLIDGRDYVKLTQKGELSATGQTLIEYHLSLDAGKHIAMMSGTDKGFEVREYFLKCERISQAPFDASKILSDPAAMRGLLLTYTEKVLALEEKVGAMQVTVDAHDRIANADGALCITNAAKLLQVRPKDLFALLQANRWIYRRAGGKGWIGYQERIQAGHLEHKVTTVDRSDGSQKIVENVLITAKGVVRLSVLLSRSGGEMLALDLH